MQYSSIVRHLQEYRKKRNILQTEMAEHLNITQSEYSKLELGKTKMSYDVLSKLYKHGCDIDMLITGENAEEILPSLEKVYIESDNVRFVSWLKLCEWALEQWLAADEKEAGIGNRLLKIFVSADSDMTPLEKVRKAYGVSQQQMADIVGVNIKKYRQLEKGKVQLDAELMSNIYEATKCRPSFFMDENSYYLSVISEECRYGKNREEQLNTLLSMQEKFEEK